MTNFFVVDVEAAGGATPATGRMTEFGAVEISSMQTYHGVLWDTVPREDHPGTFTIVNDTPYDHRYVMADFSRWINDVASDERAVMFSDNPAFDFMWIAYNFDNVGLENPFGYSARRIGDLFAGLKDNWKDTSSWKKHRKTKHDHNPVNDAVGNAEALKYILRKYHQKTNLIDP